MKLSKKTYRINAIGKNMFILERKNGLFYPWHYESHGIWRDYGPPEVYQNMYDAESRLKLLIEIDKKLDIADKEDRDFVSKFKPIKYTHG